MTRPRTPTLIAAGTLAFVAVSAAVPATVVSFTFADGTFVADGEIAFPEESLPEPFTVAITSGTGAYAGARGTLTVTEREESNALKATYSTGGQVSEVPAGGADAGGGFADGSDNSAVLLGLGALAAAGGAGLVLGGRRLRRD